MKHITIRHEADNKKTGLTIRELGTFLQETHRAGINPDTHVRVTVGFRGQIHKIEVQE